LSIQKRKVPRGRGEEGAFGAPEFLERFRRILNLEIRFQTRQCFLAPGPPGLSAAYLTLFCLIAFLTTQFQECLQLTKKLIP